MARLSTYASMFASLAPLVHAASFLPFLNFTSSSPLIFHSLASLLQVQPQTLFPNGHTIASVTVPRHTLLYHGRHDSDPVPSPEWLAFDIEMAYAIMGNMPDSRMLSYRTTRNVRAVYFDGTSANLMGEGPKSQMVFIYNGTDDIPKRGGFGPPRRPPPGRGRKERSSSSPQDEDEHPHRPPGRPPPGHWNPLQDEYFRARELCKWLASSGLGGQGWGYEAIVRMNAGFELIWCDFDSPSLKLVSNLNVSAPLLSEDIVAFESQQQLPMVTRPILKQNQAWLGVVEDEGPHGPGMSDPREPFRNTSNWFWFSAAAKRYVGDSRMRLDSSGVFSFYEPGLRNQTHTRVTEDIDKLKLSPDGRWPSKHSESHSSLFSKPDFQRTDKLDDLTLRRRQHHLSSVDEEDASYMREAVERRLKKALAVEQGDFRIDWHHVAKEIRAMYSKELMMILKYLQKARPHKKDNSMKEWIVRVRQLTHRFLLPFFEYPPERPYSKEKLLDLFDLQSPLALKTLERCIAQYDIDEEPLNDEDAIFGQAIKETLHGLCSTIIKIGLGIEYHWFMYFDKQPGSKDEVPYFSFLKQARDWEEDMEELMAWLGWVEQWSTCNKKCGFEEMCYIPMWPVNGWNRRGRWGEESKYLWEPVCVSMDNYPPEEWNTEEY